ncbi:MAG: efflux RND transporter periplasmic adaptor subunit [Burkholderiales bacterium]|nr:efflux RND transporter periplasmic adaptor subunit [Burkholderiales bacterium]
MKRSKSLVTALATTLVLAVVAGAAFWRFGRALPVSVVDAVQGRVALRVVGPGTLQARVPVTLAARITATVRQVNVDVGDVVRRGQTLALLDDRDLAARRAVVGGQQVALARNAVAAEASIAKAQADLELARSKQQRDAELLRTGFVSQAVLDTSNATLQAAAASLANARAAHAAREADVQALSQEARYADAVLSFTRIVAPMDGVVVARQAEVGATVVPGSALLRVVDPATLWMAMRVDESVIGRVHVGQAASMRMRSGETVTGKVARIARQSDAATRELEVHVAFDTLPERFAIDQEAEVAIAAGEVAGIVVPLAALTRDRQGRQGVLVVAGSRTEFRPVQTGASDGERVLVAKGLASGERVVAEAGGVKAGVRVSTSTSASASVRTSVSTSATVSPAAPAR